MAALHVDSAVRSIEIPPISGTQEVSCCGNKCYSRLLTYLSSPVSRSCVVLALLTCGATVGDVRDRGSGGREPGCRHRGAHHRYRRCCLRRAQGSFNYLRRLQVYCRQTGLGYPPVTLLPSICIPFFSCLLPQSLARWSVARLLPFLSCRLLIRFATLGAAIAFDCRPSPRLKTRAQRLQLLPLTPW